MKFKMPAGFIRAGVFYLKGLFFTRKFFIVRIIVRIKSLYLNIDIRKLQPKAKGLEFYL